MAREVIKAIPTKCDLRRMQYNYINSKCLFTTYNLPGAILLFVCINSFNHFNNLMKYIPLSPHLTDFPVFYIYCQ